MVEVVGREVVDREVSFKSKGRSRRGGCGCLLIRIGMWVEKGQGGKRGGFTLFVSGNVGGTLLSQLRLGLFEVERKLTWT